MEIIYSIKGEKRLHDYLSYNLHDIIISIERFYFLKVFVTLSTHIHVRDISHAIHGVCTLWFTYDSMLLLCAQFTVGIPHPTNHMPPNFREFFYIGDENISPAPNLAKGGGGEGVR